MRLRTWSPLTMRELFALTDRSGSRLITSAGDLLAELMAALRKFEEELHGAQTPVRNLWDRQGSTQLYRPIDENGLSDEITRHLRQELGRSGIFANREVEVKRRPGAPVGQRSDILINAARIGSDRRPRDTLSAVIEVKGCWNPDLLTALDAQLVKDYMVDTGAPVASISLAASIRPIGTRKIIDALGPSTVPKEHEGGLNSRRSRYRKASKCGYSFWR